VSKKITPAVLERKDVILKLLFNAPEGMTSREIKSRTLISKQLVLEALQILFCEGKVARKWLSVRVPGKQLYRILQHFAKDNAPADAIFFSKDAKPKKRRKVDAFSDESFEYSDEESQWLKMSEAYRQENKLKFMSALDYLEVSKRYWAILSNQRTHA
jgi:predicted DNA-binding transcriptional regulator